MAYKKIMAAAFAVTLFLAGCAGSTDKGTSQAAVPLKETMNPISVRQLVAADNEHNRTIMFQLLKSVEAFVEYREKGNDRIFSVSAKGAALKGNNGITDSYIYTAELTDLKKGTAYEYRTRTGNTVSGWMDFRTDDGGAFKAVIYPDSQSADYTGWSKLATKAYELNKDAALFISMGDLVDNGQDEYQWQAWMRSMKGIMDTIPGAVMMGNHEYYSLDWKMAKPDRYLAHFHLPNNGDADYKDHFYSFDWGDVHFTVLDTQLNELKEWYPDLFEREKKWAADDLARTDKKWKVVLMHKDPLQYAFAGREGREEGFSPEGQEFMPVFDASHVDLVLSAHLHTYRDRGRIYDFRRAETGPYYIITGVAGDVRYPGLWKAHSLDIYFAPQPETDNYLVMEAGEDVLVVTGYTSDGQEMHKSVIRK